MKHFIIVSIVILTSSTFQLGAQNISAYLVMGSNFTEAKLTESGRSQVGFRMGLNTGAGVSLKLNKKLELGAEMLYSQNGLYVKFAQLPSVALDKISLHYFEVPVFLSYPIVLTQKESRKNLKQRIGGGIAYARLYNHKFIGIQGTDVTDDVIFDQKSALLFNFTATSFFSESFGVDGRLTLATVGDLTFALRMLYSF